MQAIILAGGFGTRLKSEIGDEIPKPMAPLGDEPFLAMYLRYLKQQGIGKVTLSVHHLADVIRDYFGSEFEGIKLSYAEEDKPLGTGGAVQFALQKMQAKEPVLVVNGDTFVEIDMQAMRKAHVQNNAQLTIGLREMPDCSRYGQVLFDAQSRRIKTFKYPGDAAPGYISTGTYIISPDIFAGYDMPEAFSFEADFQHKYVSDAAMFAWPTDGYFIDIGIPADYARAKDELPHLIAKTKAA